MFKKLVTNLPYSPGLLNQVGFYTNRLKQEEFVRRMGMIFGILALLLNLNLTMFAPEASVLASPANDVVAGGIYGSDAKTMQDKAIASMNSSAYTKAIYDYYGITEQDIRGTTVQYLNTGDESFRSVGKQAFARGAEVCRTHNGYYFCERSMNAAYRYRSLNVKALTGIRANRVGTADPWFALLESCGNVVVRTGKDESISISKTLSPDQGASVKAGDTVRFRVKVKSNNANGASKPVITDTLPEHTTYLDHSPKDLFDKAAVNGRTVTLSSTRAQYGLGPNEERVIEIKALISNSAPAGAKLCNKVSAKSLADSAVSNTEPCVTVETPEPQPMCTNLKMLGLGGTNRTRSFEATAKPDGATISSYVFMFGDGQTETVTTSSSKASISHTYSPGSYTAKVLVKTSSGDFGNSGACVTNLNVDEPTPDPTVTCDYIKLVSGVGADKKRDFEVSATPQNGATVSAYTVDFGDGQNAQITNNSNNKSSISHTYGDEGAYTVRVTADTSLGQVTNNSSCILEVEIEEGPCEYDATLPKDDPECVPPVDPCEYDSSLPKDDPECVEPTPNILRLKKAENVTQGIANAHNTTAKGGDTIKYSLVTENDGNGEQVDYVIREDMGDVLQYSDIIDMGGGTLSDDGYVITWPKTTIAAGEVVTKHITVKVKSPVPNTPVAASDPLAYDLVMENAYGNNVTIKLPKTPPKQVEEVVTSLPNTGPGENAFISTLFIMVVSYFYFRNRLIAKELKLIKTEFSGGAI